MHRCDFEPPVVVMTKSWGGGMEQITVHNAGYVIRRHGRPSYWVANTYGSVNPDSYSKEFVNIDEAKRYVEEQALVGITLNKLTR